MSEEQKVQEFYLYGDRFLQQVGDGQPRFVWASPEAPARVRLPATIIRDGVEIPHPEDALLKRAPEKPLVDVRPNVQGSAAPPNVAQPVKKKSGKRAADQ